MTINFPTALYIIGAKRKLSTDSEQKNPDKRTRRY